MFSKSIIFSMLLLLTTIDSGCCSYEPRCSKFDFEEKVLEKLIRLELKVETSLNDMKQFVTDLTEKQENVTDMKLKVDASLNDVNKALAVLSALQESVTDTVGTLRNDTIKVMTDKLENMGKNKGTRVAFVVYNPEKALVKHKPIVFRTIVLNLESGYNYKTGLFTAPVSGLYLFSAQICSKKYNVTSYQLVVNNVVMGAAHQYDRYGDGVCSSMTTVAKVDGGQTVEVRCLSGGSLVVNSATEQWNMFVGALIAE